MSPVAVARTFTARTTSGARSGWVSLALFSLAVLILLIAALELYATATITFVGLGGIDINMYLAATRRWIETGTPYMSSEIAAPFAYSPTTFLHPPIALLLFAPFLVLPLFLWWAIPIAITVACIASWRPAAWTWPIMALLVALPTRIPILVVGNSDLWVCAFLALALRWGWPAVLVIVKPSLAVFAVVGMNRRSWWIAAAVLGALALLFGSLWIDWIRVVLHSPGSLLYSIGSVPTILIPVVAHAARARTGEPVRTYRWRLMQGRRRAAVLVPRNWERREAPNSAVRVGARQPDA